MKYEQSSPPSSETVQVLPLTDQQYSDAVKKVKARVINLIWTDRRNKWLTDLEAATLESQVQIISNHF